MDLLRRLQLIVFAISLFAHSMQGHNVEKRDADDEQDRIRKYQMGVLAFIRFQHQGGKMEDVTEPLQCFTCTNARTNAECNRLGMQTCQSTQTACRTEIRIKGHTRVRITKGCKREVACNNNYKQNGRQAWPSTQCNSYPETILSVCRHCCREKGCNAQLPERHCRQVYMPENGRTKCQRTDGVGPMKCSFTCDECHTMFGSKDRTCLENREWSGNDTECVYDEMLPGCALVTTCPEEMATPPENGQVNCTDGVEFGSECTFSCDSTFVLIGKSVLQCDGETKEWDGVKPYCVEAELDECAVSPCDEHAECKNVPGSYECTCGTGYEGDGHSCTDIDECITVRMPCSLHGMCKNTDGGYECECKPGYIGDGKNCYDVNECSMANSCSPEANCVNSFGSYTCDCRTGYEGDGQTCTDIDECSPENIIPCSPYDVCVNTDGGYVCECEAGYTPRDGNCYDINECSMANPCSPEAACVNTPGSHECVCRTGYEGDGKTCTDIDECSPENIIPCSPNGNCLNTDGGYECECDAGYGERDGGCYPCCPEGEENMTCINNECRCLPGFAGDPSICRVL